MDDSQRINSGLLIQIQKQIIIKEFLSTRI